MFAFTPSAIGDKICTHYATSSNVMKSNFFKIDSNCIEHLGFRLSLSLALTGRDTRIWLDSNFRSTSRIPIALNAVTYQRPTLRTGAMDWIGYPHSINISNSNRYIVTDNHNSIINLNKVIADERPEILRWLSPLDLLRRHQDVRTDRLDGLVIRFYKQTSFGSGICGKMVKVKRIRIYCFVIGIREWKRNFNDMGLVFWSKQELSLAFSNISSLMIDRLCDEAGQEDMAVAGFYCDFCDQREQRAVNIIGAILKQPIATGGALGVVRKTFKKAKLELRGRSLRLPDVVEMVKWAIITLLQVFICVDALDESLPKQLLELLWWLKDIL